MDMANVVWVYSERGVFASHDLSFFEVLIKHFTTSMQTVAYTPHTVANIIWCIAKLMDQSLDLRLRLWRAKFFSTQFVPRVARLAGKSIKNFNSQELECTIKGAGRFGDVWRWRPFLMAAFQIVFRKLRHMTMADLVSITLCFWSIVDPADF